MCKFWVFLEMFWDKPMTPSMAEILWLQEGVQIPLRTHLVDVEYVNSSSVPPRKMETTLTIISPITEL